jgi:hypothetical protein
MSAFTMENLSSRIKRFTSTSALTLALLSGLVACSSRNGAISDVNTKDEEISSINSQNELSDGLEMTSIDQPTDQEGSQSDSLSSLPVSYSKKKYTDKSSRARLNMRNWGGQLHTQYSPDMKEWTVARGESLSLIAEGVFGNKNSLNKLLALNPQIVDPNVLNVGQVISLPFVAQDAQSEELAKAPQVDAPVAQVGNNDNKVKEDSSLAVVSNNPKADVTGTAEASASLSIDSQAQGAMETVPVAVAAAPSAPSMDNSVVAPNSNDELSSGASSMVKRVSNVNKKDNLKKGLLVGAIGFLVLSTIVFMLSRKKA